MKSKRFNLLTVALLGLMCCTSEGRASAQETKETTPAFDVGEASDRPAATIRGSLKLQSDIIDEIDWQTMEGQVSELVKLEQIELPAEWSTMKVADRQAWFSEFDKSKIGAALKAKNQTILDSRFQKNFQVREAGKFVIYDVPQGQYEMKISAQTNVDGKTWLVQSYGQFAVGEVDELDFSNMPLDVMRVLSSSEEAPGVTGKSLAGSEIELSSFRGKPALLVFGLTSSNAFKVTTASLRELVESVESEATVQVVTVTLDENLDSVKKFNEENSVTWPCINLGKWDQETLFEYGIRSVPSFWLIDAQGKIILTGQQFVAELNRRQTSVRELVEDALAGKLDSKSASEK